MLYLLIFVAVLAIGIPVVLLRNRKPSSMGRSMGAFSREMNALRPEQDDSRGA